MNGRCERTKEGGLILINERPAPILRCAMLALIVTGIILFASCGSHTPPKFHEGELVRMKLDGRVGMVIWVYPDFERQSKNSGAIYDVRVSSDRVVTADTKLLEKDGAVHTLPYQKIMVNEYELERVEETK
jgi:hypothetical protein